MQEEKYDVIFQIGYERYIHKRLTFDDMRTIDWNNEINIAITQAQYDNKE